MERKRVVVGLGEVLWDLLPAGKQLGGAPANFAYHAHALGAEAHVASAVGEDALGREIVHALQGLGLSTAHVARASGLATGTVSVALDANGQPAYTIHEPAAWDAIPFSADLEALAARADAVCFGSLSQRAARSTETIRRFLGATRRACVRVFDINLRQAYFTPAVVEAGLQAASILKLNDEELPVVAGLLGIAGDEDAVLAHLVDEYDLALVALTRGAAGSLLVSPSARSEAQGRAVAVRDTVGAGDAFTAALVMGLLAGDALDEVHARASRVAAYVCTQHGATPSMDGFPG